jgi:iron complex transport system substrate-binding protein
VDQAGRTVTIPAQVNRVASDYPAVNQMILQLGAANKLAADTQDSATGLFPALDPGMKAVPSPFSADTSQVNLEALLAARPDVVFLPSISQSLLGTFQRAGIPAVVLSTFDTPRQLVSGVQLVANVLGGNAPAQASGYVSYYNATLARVTSATGHLPPASKPTVYYDEGSPLVTEGKNSMVTTWIDEAGGTNVAADHGVTGVFQTVNLEDLVSWNPDFIICRDAATQRQILQDPRYQAITAVRENHVLVNPQGVFVWSVRSAEEAMQPLWAATLLHPNLFPNTDMRQVVRNFYQRFYHYTPTDQQIDSILNP